MINLFKYKNVFYYQQKCGLGFINQCHWKSEMKPKKKKHPYIVNGIVDVNNQ